MKALLLLSLVVLAVVAGQNSNPPGDSPVAVLGQKWGRERLSVEQAESVVVPPAAAMIPANKNRERARRANAPIGERDPNDDTVDGRSAALERSVASARAPKPIEGYAYRAKFKNSSSKAIEALFWEYQFREAADSAYLSRRQFLCVSSIKPDKEKELKGFSLSGPSDVVSVGTLTKKDPERAFNETVVINRIEFADGTTWQRRGWKAEEIKLSYQRAVNSPWTPDQCKGL
ncbi:MAG TPA: hypothetical protein VEW46_18500 [Pyrinomonadaceae bacterium]|nr:hypothetical protein [Pyrinomonadaceae bacterium]